MALEPLVAGEAEMAVQCVWEAEQESVEEAVVGRRVRVAGRRRLTADSGDVRCPGGVSMCAPLPATPARIDDGAAALACHRLTGSMTTWCRERGDAVAGRMTV